MTEFKVILAAKNGEDSPLMFFVHAVCLNEAYSAAKRIQDDLYGGYYVESVTHKVYGAF